MLVLNLACESGHLFEGWFASSDDCDAQQRRGLLSCPLCGSPKIERRPSAPRLNVSHLRQDPAGQGGSTDAPPRPGTLPFTKAPPPMPANHVSAAQTRAQEATADEGLLRLQQLQARYLQVARELARAAEDVGDRFAEEARRIHHGDAEDRAIRGQSSPEEVRELLDEGIPLMPLILPEGSDGELH